MIYAVIFQRRLVYVQRTLGCDLAPLIRAALIAKRFETVSIRDVRRVEGDVPHIWGAEYHEVTYLDRVTGMMQRDRVTAAPR